MLVYEAHSVPLDAAKRWEVTFLARARPMAIMSGTANAAVATKMPPERSVKSLRARPEMV